MFILEKKRHYMRIINENLYNEAGSKIQPKAKNVGVGLDRPADRTLKT